MNKKQWVSRLVGGCALSAAMLVGMMQSAAAEGVVRARASYSSNTYDLSGDYRTATSDFNALGVGITFAAESGWYLDVFSSSSSSATHDIYARAGDFEREDFSVTVGFAAEGFGMFAGYKSGESILHVPSGLVSPPAWTYDKFESAGVFGGVSLSTPTGPTSSLSGSVALALMGATWTDDAGFSDDADTAVGFSLGASWSTMFGPNFGASLDFKYQMYSFDFGDATTFFFVDEEITSIGASVFVQF